MEISSLLTSAKKNIKRISVDVAALKRYQSDLDDQQRAAFRKLRDMLNELVGD